MKKGVYAVKDLKSKQFAEPFIDVNDAAALRGFAFAVNNGNLIMKFSPADFRLYKVGEFDTELGVVVPLVSGIELVAAGEDVKEIENG